MKRATWVAIGVAVGLTGCGSSTKTVTVVTVTKPATTSSTATAAAASTTSGATTTGTTTTAAPSASTSTATPTPPPAPVVHLTTFESPSRNIGCIVLDGTARCDINHRDWSPPPRPAKCPNEVDFGQGLEVSGSSPGQLVCAGDTAMDPSAPKLGYGTDSVEGKFRCASTTAGMTCTDTTTGHGFSISIQSYRVF